jgi:hypothetical protein
MVDWLAALADAALEDARVLGSATAPGACGPTVGAVFIVGGGHTMCSAAELLVVALGPGPVLSVVDFGAGAGAASRTAGGTWTGAAASTGCATTFDGVLSGTVVFRACEATCDEGKPTSAIVRPATKTTPIATATNTSRFVVREGGGGASGGRDGRELERDSASICDLLLAVLLRSTLVIRFDRVRFFDVFCVRTTPSPTSADTSNIHRTFRPARSAGTLIACFGIAAVCLPGEGNSRACRFRPETGKLAGRPVTRTFRNESV